MKVAESYTFPDGHVSRVLQDAEGKWFLGNIESGIETIDQTDDEGAKLIIALAQDAKRRDAMEWPDIIE